MKKNLLQHGVILFIVAFAIIMCFTLPQDVTAASAINITAPEYGAKSGDQNSDREAIQKALDMAKGSSSVVTIQVPAGTYYVERPLKIYSNTHMVLDQNATIKRMSTTASQNANILFAVDQNGKRDQIGGYSMCHDITLEGGTWDGGNASLATDDTDLIRFDHGTNITVKDCTVKNVYDCHLIEFVAVKNGFIHNVKLSGYVFNKKTGTSQSSEAIQLDSAWTNNPSNLNDNGAKWADGSKVDGTHCENIVVDKCTFTNLPKGVGQHHYSSSSKYQNSKNITIKDNTITASTGTKGCRVAIPCGGMDNVTIANNTIIGPYEYGVNAYHGKNITISGNQIRGIKHNAIGCFSAGLNSIKNNTIHTASYNGISVQDCSVGVYNNNTTGIQNNSITGCGTNGICIFKKTKVYYVKNNTITSIKKHGILVTDTCVVGAKALSGSGICTNTINTCKQNGICISGGNTSYVYGNKIYNSKKNGISFGKGKIYMIKGNYIKKAKLGIYAYKKKRVKKKITGNKFSKCKRKMYVGK